MSGLTKGVAMACMLALWMSMALGQTAALKPELDSLPAWSAGFLDIHHINTGEGNSTFLQLPDGTTVLLDAGTVDKEAFERHNFPLKATAHPAGDSMTAGERIAWYIKRMSVRLRNTDTLDYLLVSHFHGDHYGGIPDLLAHVHVSKLIDRDYPKYDFPLDLRRALAKDTSFQHYLALADSLPIVREKLQVGRSDQVGMRYQADLYPSFRILNVKNSATIWNPITQKSEELFGAQDMLRFYKGGYNENPLSMALKISYGPFDYYNGADNTGLQDGLLPTWFDVETPIAKVVGRVEAMTLDHHGNRDANNRTLIEALDPRVVVQQVYSSDQPGQEVYYRLKTLGNSDGRMLYATNMHPETSVTYGPWFYRGYASMQGHVVIRVYPEGTFFQVFVLDEADLHIKKQSDRIKAQ